MPFPSVLSSPQLTKIRSGNGYSATPYILVNPNDIVFAAQVNQSSFNTTFASITFDNVTSGTITDVKDGFTVYVWGTSGIIPQFAKDATFIGRARGNGSAGTTLNINETSADISNNEYIIVVKDVAIREKLGRYTNKTLYIDWDVTFRRLLPRVTGLKSCYAQVLSGGSATFTFPAVGKATDIDDTVSSWLWDADGGSFVNGTSSTDAQPDIQYTSAGVYWPRVTVTGTQGNSNWFTMPVFVVSADYSDSFIFGINDINITADIRTGYNLTFSNVDQNMLSTPDGTFIAIWNIDDYAGDNTPILDDIAFVGRLLSDTPSHDVDTQYERLQSSTFTCESILAQLGRIRSPQLGLQWKSSPTIFGQIKNMTQWRAVSFILSEFSTATNVCSLTFDYEDNTYQNKNDGTDDSSLLVSCNKLLVARSLGQLNQAASGEIYGATNANFISVADRNALDTIVTLTDNDTFGLSIQHPHKPTTGQITGFAGGYNTTTGKQRILRATAPAVASLEAQNIGSPVDGIVLDNDQNLTAQKTEIEQITADALADKNLKDEIQLRVLDGYWFVITCTFQWYKYQPDGDDTNRNIDYTNSRFLLVTKTMTFDNALQSWTTSIKLRLETRGISAQTISQVAPGAQQVVQPIIPSVSAYPNFQPLPSLYLPDGATEDDSPAIAPGDGDIINSPVEPDKQANKGEGGQNNESIVGNIAAIWSVDNVYMARDIGEPGIPNWQEVWNSSETDIVAFQFVRGNDKAYVMESDDTPIVKTAFTNNILDSIVLWTNRDDINNLEASLLRIPSSSGAIMYGIAETYSPVGGFNPLEYLNGDGIGDGPDLYPYDFVSPHSGSSNRPGTYNAGADRYQDDGQPASNGGKACNIAWNVPPGVTITKIGMSIQWNGAGGTASGERTCELAWEKPDGTIQNIPFNFGNTYTIPTSGSGAIGLGTSNIPSDKRPVGGKVLFHASIRGIGAQYYIRITAIDLFGIAEADHAATRYTDDNGEEWQPARDVGKMDLGEGSFDVRNTQRTLAAKNEQVRRSPFAGFGYDADAGGGSTPGQFAKAIWKFGSGGEDTCLLATDNAKLYYVDDGVPNDITPNDGIADGQVLGPNAICMARSSVNHIWAMCDFGGTVKLAYTSNGSAASPTWNFNTHTFTSSSLYIRVKDTREDVVMVAGGTTLHYSNDGGVSFTDKTVPATGIIGVEIK